MFLGFRVYCGGPTRSKAATAAAAADAVSSDGLVWLKLPPLPAFRDASLARLRERALCGVMWRASENWRSMPSPLRPLAATVVAPYGEQGSKGQAKYMQRQAHQPSEEHGGALRNRQTQAYISIGGFSSFSFFSWRRKMACMRGTMAVLKPYPLVSTPGRPSL